jgi:hypothetical protein
MAIRGLFSSAPIFRGFPMAIRAIRWPAFALLAIATCFMTSCTPEEDRTPAPADPPPRKDKADVVRKELSPNITLEVEGTRRRVFVNAAICQQKCQLELLMTCKELKAHEAVLNADIDARMLKTAFLVAGAREGKPVQFDPYRPASGQTMKITVEYFDKDSKLVSLDAKQWVRDAATKKPLAHDWVFTGSRLIPNPLDAKKTIFLANDGDVVCVSNFESALLDLPIKSSKDNAELQWETNTEKIPAIGTKVTVIFEAVPEKKK